MTLKEIKNFLREKKGYLKEGRTRLAKRLELNHKDENVTDLCAQALREVRSEFKNDNPNYGLEIKSRWQSASGEWLESYKNSDNTLDDLIELKEDLFDDLKNLNNKEYHNYKFVNKNLENLLEISLPDFHLGKTDGSSIEDQCKKYVQSIIELTNKVKSIDISRIVLPTGNDLFNSDTLDHTTTRGTPQLDNAPWQLTFRSGVKAVISSIEYLKKIAPVDVIIVQGNHDYQKCFYLGEILEAYYHLDPVVTIDNDINSPRKYYKFGKVLLGYTHGDKEKGFQLPLTMAVEKPKEFADSNFQYWRLGHLHKEMVNEYQGVVVETLPALCKQDEWHKKMGYNSKRKAKAYIWNYTYGQEGHVQINK